MANLPQVIPMSPQAAQFARYGEIPVGHTTGVPQINIPIYTLSTNWIDIPISISYHASGFRPNDIPSPVGLGWVLNAGGMISRSVEMNPDDNASPYSWLGQNQIKSAADVASLKDGTKTFGTLNFHQQHSWDKWEPFFFTSYIPQFDTRSDRYHYSYLGNSGVARYDVDTKALTSIPYDPIKIEKISNGFVITDTKGIKYEFMQTESTNAPGKGSFVSGWYLTKITCPGKESEPIVFTYQTGTSYYDSYSSFNQSTRIIDTRAAQMMYGYETIGRPEAGSQTSYNAASTLYSSPLVSSITWKNTTITFNYASDRQDQRKDRITSITVSNGENTVKQALFNNNSYFGNSSQNYRLKLSGVLIKGSNATSEGEPYSFNYYGEGAPIPNYENICNYDYWGYYNGTSSYNSFPSDINIDQATGNMFAGANFYHNVPSTNRKPDESSTKICVLKEIIYPTKGKSVFDYELNQVPNAYQFMTNYNWVGGLRLRQRTNYSDPNTIADIKSYVYEGYPTQILKNDLFLYRMEYIDSYYYMINIYWGLYVPINIEYPGYHFTGMPMTSLSGWTGSNVFYNKVKEYNGTAPNTSEGWIEYDYEEENRELNNTCSWNVDEFPPYMFSKYVDCDKGNIREQLKYVTYYNKNGNKVKRIENQYQPFSIPSAHTGVRVFQNAIYPSGPVPNPGGSKSFQDRLDFYGPTSGNTGLKQTEYENFYLNKIYSIDTYGFCDVSLPSSTTEIEYVNGVAALSKTTSYNYDMKDGKPILFTPSLVTTQNSKGETVTQKISFPYSDTYKNSAPYNIMVSKNILSPVIEKSEFNNAHFLRKTVTEYKDWGNGLFAPEFVKLQGNSQSALETRITYYNYDQSGNPLYLSNEADVPTCYLWEYNKSYPIAEVKGANINSIAYTSFEADGTGYWSGVVSSSIQGTGGITGKKYYNRTGFSLSKNGLSASSAYTVTYWSKNGAYSVNGAAGVASRTSNGWTLYEHLVTGQSTITVSGSGAIDELRLHPKNAMMTTYTYDPLVGMTSQTDVANRTTYYEYDSFGR
ncbi:MAG: hypothetical protein EOO89_11755, partial [Pedobacter sp.]